MKGLLMAEREQLEAWLAATAQGDEQAFGQLYSATSSQLYSLLLRINILMLFK